LTAKGHSVAAEAGLSKTHAAILSLLESERERRANEQHARPKAALSRKTLQTQQKQRQTEERERLSREAEATRAQQKVQREENERQAEVLRLLAMGRKKREKEEEECRAREAEALRVQQQILSAERERQETERLAREAQREQNARQAEVLQLLARAREKRETEEQERQAREAEALRVQQQILAAERERLERRLERELRAREAEAVRVRQELLAAERKRQNDERLARQAEAARVRQERLAAERKRQETERLVREAEAAQVLQEFLAAERERQERERLARETEAEAARVRQELLAAERARQEKARLERKEAVRQAQRAKKEAARKIREAELEARRLEIAKQEAVFTTKHIVLGSTLITCGAGIDIKHVISGFESCRLTVKNLPPNAKLSEIADLFTQQGINADEFLILGTRGVDGGRHLEAKVLTNAEQGQAIAVGLDGINFRDETLSFEVTDNSSADAMGETSARNPEVLAVSWRAPSASIIATYDSMDAARTKARALDKTIWRGRRIKVEMNSPPTGPALRYYDPSSIKITGLHPDATPMNVVDLTGSAATKAIKSPLYDLQAVYQVLEQHMRTVSNDEMTTFDIISQPNGGVDGNITVQIRFKSWEQAKTARDSLDGQRLRPDFPHFRFFLPNPLQFVSTIPIQQYRAQKRQWDSLGGNKNNEGSQLRINIYENERVALRVVGEDKKAVGSLKVRVETLVAGERLDVTYWHRSFNSPKGRQFLAKVSSDADVYVRSDWKVHALRIYGDGDAKDEARRLILAEIDRFALLEWTVMLKRQSVGYFVRKGLAALQEILGEDAVSLDLSSTPCKLTIRGGEEARHHLSMLLDQSLEEMDIHNSPPGTTDICPICYDTVSHPVQLDCGHIYCTECIRHYLKSACDTKVFPLVCMGNEAQCKVAIPIPAIQRFLPPQRFDNLVNVAFSTYIDLHPKDFRYCTTPDCIQIYRCNAGEAQKCPSCFAAVCSSCHEEAHEGMTCAERALHKNPTEQERLNELWASENGVKKCPSCKVWIEKTYGCNHMTCICGAHICWKCMGIFRGDEIYNHLTEEHGGILEGDAVDEGALARQQEFEANQHQREAERRLRVEVNERQGQQAREYAAVQATRVEAYRQEAAMLARRQRQAGLDREAVQRQRLYVQQQEAQRRAEYQRQLDRRQEELIRQATERRRKESWCVVM
jgi:hypothetical protein